MRQQLPIFLLFRDRRRVAQQCWIRLHCSSNIVGATHAHIHMISKVVWDVSFPRYTACPNLVGSCCIHLHTTANTHATTPNIAGPTMLGVVASVCTPLPTRTQQLTTLLGQQCWELFVPLHVDLHCYAGWEPVNCWQVFPNQKRTLQAVMGDSKGTLLLYWTHADSSSPTGKGCVNGKETFEELSHLCLQNLELKGISEETNKQQQRPHARRTTSLCSEFPFLIFKFVDHRKTTGKQWKEKNRLLKW